MSRRKDWCTDQARQVHAVISGGCSEEVAVTYLASVLRMAHQRGAIEGAKAKDAVKTTRIGGGLPV